MLRYVLTASIISLGTLATPRTHAAPTPAETRPASIRDLLASIDVVPPDRQALERAFPNARAELMAIAADPKESDWTRLRAVSLLSFFPEAATRALLVTLADDTRVDVRRTALYTLGRAFGAIDPTVVPVIVKHIDKDPDVTVREHAVRALRWVDAPEAGTELQRIATSRRDVAEVARHTLERRTTRLTK